MPDSCSLVWFRQDLRLEDNPALQAAAAAGRPVLGVFVLDDDTPGRWRPGGAARWWLHHSLKALGEALEKKGGKLILRRGRADREVLRLAGESAAAAVFWNRASEPYGIACEQRLARELKRKDVETRGFNCRLLYEPGSVCTRSGEPYKVFTAFWRAARERSRPDAPEPAPRRIPAPGTPPSGDRLEDWELLPSPDWAGGLRNTWSPGETGGRRALDRFLQTVVGHYGRTRDLPATEGTSRLSPHLAHGELSPRTVWSAVTDAVDFRTRAGPSAETFLSELGWREFNHHLLHHFPDLPESCLNPKFRDFPWQADTRLFRAWTRGETGYPLVDAGMRQLWQTGWMHNRVRMNAGSLLVKHLLQPWQDGEAWFWDTLVDADLASNSANWQWVAGCGADAAPYFRVFNPALQGARFDPDGDYVREFVPELAQLPASYIHKPWEAPDSVLRNAGLQLDRDYPKPVIGHREGRERALAAFGQIKGGGS